MHPIDFALTLANATPPAGGGGGGTPAPQWYVIATQFVPLLLIGVFFYFILIAPQRRKQKETQKMLAAVEKGDRVVTIGGILGTVTQVTEDTVTLKVDESSNTKLRFQKSALASIEAKESKPPAASS